MSYTLYGQQGFGSTCVEAALELHGIDYDFEEADPLDGAAGLARVKSVNPLGQVPALILPNDDVMTESAAILIWLGDLDGQYRWAPRPDAPERAEYLRWMIFMSSSFYSTLTITDGPARFHPDPATHKTLLHQAVERRKQMWRIIDTAFKGATRPYLLGETMSLLDVYVAMMSHWSPCGGWFLEHCPNLAGAVRATEKHPVIRDVWRRNFDLEVQA
ncbi:glutathione S-transferase family protein [Maricaulis salignorans]|uniref:GST-like protein n=1 Tax=Maricaulis salignorans TaxID=144026 RepID=A0A1G9UQJ5_9PROT|nr:glutathione S-transferase family protein [Maricaulis salignorans]SDM62221.1 GST-like protein [Maricaulis salignorans]